MIDHLPHEQSGLGVGSFQVGHCFSQSLAKTAVVLSAIVFAFEEPLNVSSQFLQHLSVSIINRAHLLEFCV